jgi:hypothetical protein
VDEVNLLDRALEAFRAATDLPIQVERSNIRNRFGQEIDVIVRLRAYGVDEQFAIELKTNLTNPTLGVIAQHLVRFPYRGLLVTGYLNPRMAERLREMNIFFLDAAGNAYLNIPPVFVFIKGNKPPERLTEEPKIRAFQPTGLKVVFTLLRNPKLVNAPYRDIARAAGVALGTVGWVVTGLKELGHIVDMGKRSRRLKERSKLLDRWVVAYPERLRPKLLIGRYVALEVDWWKQALPHNFNAYRGGEVAAARLTSYLRPEQVIIYVRERAAQLQLAYKLRKDPDGNIELLKAFWDIENDRTEKALVPPVLIYADLLATGDPRNIETAHLLYDQELARLIRED